MEEVELSARFSAPLMVLAFEGDSVKVLRRLFAGLGLRGGSGVVDDGVVGGGVRGVCLCS